MIACIFCMTHFYFLHCQLSCGKYVMTHTSIKENKDQYKLKGKEVNYINVVIVFYHKEFLVTCKIFEESIYRVALNFCGFYFCDIFQDPQKKFLQKIIPQKFTPFMKLSVPPLKENCVGIENISAIVQMQKYFLIII